MTILKQILEDEASELLIFMQRDVFVQFDETMSSSRKLWLSWWFASESFSSKNGNNSSEEGTHRFPSDQLRLAPSSGN